MADIHLPHTSWFSVEVAPASYQHRELAQHVLAHKAAGLNKELQTLLASYQARVDAIEQRRADADKLAKKINRLSKNSLLRDGLKAEQAALNTALKADERDLLSSKNPIKINAINRELKKISYQLGLPI